MFVQPAMTPLAHAANADEPAGATLRWMAHWEMPHLPVVDHAGRCVGVLSLDDHETRFGGIPRTLDEQSVGDLMERPPGVSPRTRLMQALRVLRRTRARALPVVDRSGRPLGILDASQVRRRRETKPALHALATYSG